MGKGTDQLEGMQSAREELVQFPSRLKELIGNNSLRKFAKRCGFSEGVLRSYLRGDTYPSLDRLITITTVGGANIEWLATGKTMPEEKSATAIDEEFFIRVCLVIDNVLRERKLDDMSLIHRTRLNIFIYESCLDTRRISPLMMDKIITLAAPNAYLVDKDEKIATLIDQLAAIEAKDDMGKVELTDQWWQKLAEEFQAKEFLIPVQKKGEVVSWLEGELKKRTEAKERGGKLKISEGDGQEWF